MASSKQPKRPQPFSAKTGQFVTDAYAKAHPSTTVQPRPKKK